MSMETVTALVLFIIGLMILFKGIRYVYKLQMIKNWNETIGEIVKADVAHFDRPEVFVKIKYYYPDLEYKYNVNDKEYVGQEFSIDKLGWWSTDKNIVTNKVNEIRKNVKLSVFYDPSDNSRSVLVSDVLRERRKHYYGLIGGGSVVMLLGVLVFFFL